MNWQVWFAIAVTIIAIYAIVKKHETRMVLLLAGFLMCLVSGEPLKALQAFMKGLTNANLVGPICSALGFAAVVTYSKCDEHLVAALAAPLKKLGGLLIPICTMITFGINIAIMSAAGTAATVGATFIPLMIRAGISPAGAAAAVAGGTMSGLMLNPGCAHDIYIAKMANMPVLEYIAYVAPYIVGLMLFTAVFTGLICCFKFGDNKPDAQAMAQFSSESKAIKVNPLMAIAPLVPLVVLLVCQIWFPKSGINVVASMLIGVAYISLVTMTNPGTYSKEFFKGLGMGYASVVGLIVAAGVFTAGLQATGAIKGFIELLKSSNDIARWGASIGPYIMAMCTGSGEAAIWAFNQAVTPSAAQFGMDPAGLGTLAVMAGQFGRTASPLAGCIIIVAGIAKVSPWEISKRNILSMTAAIIISALIFV